MTVRLIPGTTELTAPFWKAAATGSLAARRCTDCGTLQHPPMPRCAACHGESLAWVTLPPEATVYAYTVVHHPAHFALTDKVPYIVAMLETADGLKLVTDIVECAPEDVRIGMSVQLRFEQVADDIGLVHAAPA
jgi:uncharacterized OB-fold protein